MRLFGVGAARHYGPEKYLGFSISRGVKTPLHIRTMSTWKTSKKSPVFFLVLHDSPLYVNYADKSMSTCKTCTFVHLSFFKTTFPRCSILAWGTKGLLIAFTIPVIRVRNDTFWNMYVHLYNAVRIFIYLLIYLKSLMKQKKLAFKKNTRQKYLLVFH